MLLTIVMMVAAAVLSAVTGALVFGFSGFSGTVIFGITKAIILMCPIVFALISVGNCVLVYTRKSSYTIAIYLVGWIVWSLLLQIPAMLLPGMDWMIQLDLTSAAKLVSNYAVSGEGNIVITMVFSMVVIVVTNILGLIKYKATDFDF